MEKFSRCLLISVLLFCANSTMGEAIIEGTVSLPETTAVVVAPARYQNSAVAAAPPEPVVAVVYLEGTFPKHGEPPVAVMGQKNFQFTPRILPVQTGTRVEFPNMDDEFHNVLSYSKPKRLDLGRYRKEEKPPAIVFDKPGVVELGCEIHAHMSGAILVLDTPYFITTDAKGKFRLTNLPAGQYKLKAWFHSKKILEQPVDLQNGKTAVVNFPAK